MKIGKAIVVRRSTRLEELVARFNTRAQAKFYIEHAGGDFSDYEAEDSAYQRALEEVERSLHRVVKVQVIDRSFMPNFLFGDDQIVVTVGQDGLVANAAKYVRGLPIVAVNPDPARFDGVLLPFDSRQAAKAVTAVQERKAKTRIVTMAAAELADGQRLLAFNDFFIGASSHVSARYRIAFYDKSEEQSSSGIIVSTGAGSTGWLSSIFNMAHGVRRFAVGGGKDRLHAKRMAWDERRLIFVVREPFASRTSGTSIVAGQIAEEQMLTIESRMPRGGVIFSDGVEADFLTFNSGAIARIGVAEEVANLVV